MYKVKRFSKGKCPKSGCIQPSNSGGYKIISNKTGKPWNATYKTRESAENALRAYHANS